MPVSWAWHHAKWPPRPGRMSSVMNFYHIGGPFQAPDLLQADSDFLALSTIVHVVIEMDFGTDLELLPPRASSVTMPKPDKLCGNPA